MTILVIFDLDYTLTKRGTWGRLVWKSIRHKPHLWLPLLFSTIMFQCRYKLGQLPRGDVKKNMMRWGMVGKPRTTLKTMADEFAVREISTGLRPGGVQALEFHKKRGDHILIASAAVDLIVAPISEKLGVDGYVCTRMNWCSEERLLPDFASENCYGKAKLVQVQAYIKKHGLEAAEKVFYTDSVADLPVLRFVDKAIAVDPDAKLKKIASEEAFDIQYWT